MPRYLVAPIADAACDRVNSNSPILETDDLAAALAAAEHHTGVFGAGVYDAAEERLDVGFGFGVPCPDVE